MSAPDLFSYAETRRSWRRSDPATSKEAGRSASKFSAQHHAEILKALADAGRPLAAEEIADRTALDYVAVGKRTIELLRDGKIERTAEQHTNRSGRKAFRYRLNQGA